MYVCLIVAKLLQNVSSVRQVYVISLTFIMPRMWWQGVIYRNQYATEIVSTNRFAVECGLVSIYTILH